MRTIIIDESGNLGSEGNYFVIACVDTMNPKALKNIMRKKIHQAEKLFPEIKKGHAHEVKAKDAFPAVKHHMLECIASKDLCIHYIVLDKRYAKAPLMADKNIMYNYLVKIILSDAITEKDKGSSINIILDSHTVKIASTNSLKDYLKIYFNCEMGYELTMNITYVDSDSVAGYVVQAADYVANAIFTKYEHGYSVYAEPLLPRIKEVERFPNKAFV